MKKTNLYARIYQLPTFTQLKTGACCGAGFGICLGALVGAIVGACICQFFRWPLVETAFHMMVMTWLCCFLAGAILGLLLGCVGGLMTYFVFTPWVPYEYWPKMKPALKFGMLWGTIAGCALAIVIVCLVQGIRYGLWAPMEFLDHANIIGLTPLFPFVFLLLGGFLNPLRVVMLTYLLTREKEI